MKSNSGYGTVMKPDDHEGKHKMKKTHQHYNSDKHPYFNYMNEFEGVDQEDMHKKLMNPGKVDEPKWEEAKEISKKSYGEVRYPFVMWLYSHRLKGK